MNVFFSKTAKKEYEAWEKSNPKTVDKIEELIIDIFENGFFRGQRKAEAIKALQKPAKIF